MIIIIKKFAFLFINFTIVVTIIGISTSSASAQTTLDDYITSFDYEARKEMKVSSEEIVNLLISGDAILLDIRFEEEQQSWAMPYAKKMPLPEISSRFEELDKSKGLDAKYLNEGLLGLADYLRGDRAREFIDKLDAK